MKFKVSIDVYYEAVHPDMAKAVAERISFLTTSKLRKEFGAWVEDNTTISNVAGEPVEFNGEFPTESYSKERVIQAVGEDIGLKLMIPD